MTTPSGRRNLPGGVVLFQGVVMKTESHVVPRPFTVEESGLKGSEIYASDIPFWRYNHMSDR